ncbi:MAG TPA: ATP-dependent DNA ligase [Microlunatus sp.]
MSAPDSERDGVRLTHLDDELFEGATVTKRQLIDYLETVQGLMLPGLVHRPLSVIRIRPGQPAFMQKNLPKYAPDWIETSTYWVEASKREVTYPVANDWRTLLWFANQRAVEYHVTLFTLDGEHRPRSLVLDLDPPEGAGFAAVVATAHLVHRALADAGLTGAVKTSGAKGVHVFVPLAADTTTEEAAAATRALAARSERLDPTIATTAFVKEAREGKVFVDSTRAGGATVVATYSPRVRPGLPVSFPIDWADLDQITPADFTVSTVPALLGDHTSWSDRMPEPQTLPAELVTEGRGIPIARVQAMHEGKRRAARQRKS